MSHRHHNYIRPRLFRCFVTNRYYENRDEYDLDFLPQPHTFEGYVTANLAWLKDEFRQQKKEREMEKECDCYGCTTMRHPCINEKKSK